MLHAEQLECEIFVSYPVEKPFPGRSPPVFYPLRRYENKWDFNYYFVYLHQTISFFCMKQLNRIKVVLVEQNRTAKWLSEQIGKNTCSVSRWCTNTSQPDLETLFRIAEVLNVDVRELLYVEKQNYSTNLQ